LIAPRLFSYKGVHEGDTEPAPSQVRMNEPILYALAAMASFGLSDFIYKQAAAVGASHFLMVQSWFFCPLVIVYALVAGRLVPVPAALWGFLAGLFAFLGLYSFVRSLTAGPVSTNASIFRMNFIVTVLLAVAVLGEPLTGLKFLGLAFAATAAWLLLGADSKSGLAQNDAERQSLIQASIATLAFGAANFLHTMGLRHGALPETLAVAQAACFMPLATAAGRFAGGTFKPPAAAYRYGAAAAAVLLGGTISLLNGLALGQVSIVAPVAQMGFVVAALLGILVLGERITGRKAAGLAAALAALAVLAAS
jgi:transporter family protein